jgi:hypothetical protein
MVGRSWTSAVAALPTSLKRGPDSLAALASATSSPCARPNPRSGWLLAQPRRRCRGDAGVGDHSFLPLIGVCGSLHPPPPVAAASPPCMHLAVGRGSLPTAPPRPNGGRSPSHRRTRLPPVACAPTSRSGCRCRQSGRLSRKRTQQPFLVGVQALPSYSPFPMAGATKPWACPFAPSV